MLCSYCLSASLIWVRNNAFSISYTGVGFREHPHNLNDYPSRPDMQTASRPGPSQATAPEIHLSFHDESRMASSSMCSTLRATHPLRKASLGLPHLCLMQLRPRLPSRDPLGHQREGCIPLMLLERVKVPTGQAVLVGKQHYLCRNQADKRLHFDRLMKS